LGKRGTADIIGRVEKCPSRSLLVKPNSANNHKPEDVPYGMVPLRNSSIMRCPGFNLMVKGTLKK
jgi:hypothetical protein